MVVLILTPSYVCNGFFAVLAKQTIFIRFQLGIDSLAFPALFMFMEYRLININTSKSTPLS